MTHGDPRNPWKTLGSKLVYENPWIRVREDEVIRPDGQPGIYGVVQTRMATGVIALAEDGQVYLIGQWRYPHEQYSWEIVEGGTDDGETALDAAKRELREEAGLEAKHWEPLGNEIHLTNCHSDERGYLFLATGLTEVEASPDGTEKLVVKKLSLEDALRMVDTGEIQDAMSIMELLLLARRDATA